MPICKPYGALYLTNLLIALESDVLQVTLLQAMTVREKELSLGRLLRDRGAPDTIAFGCRTREIPLLMLRV